MFVVDVEETRG